MKWLWIVVLMVIVVTLSLSLAIPSASAWEVERPSGYVYFDEVIANATADGICKPLAAVGLGVHIIDFSPGGDGTDALRLAIVATANTRLGIDYLTMWRSMYSYEENVNWGNFPHYIDITSKLSGRDDDGYWLNITEFAYDFIYEPEKKWCIRFYGGPGSGEYDRIWICINGFISVVDNSTNPVGNIPNRDRPNGVIAPYGQISS